MAYDNYTYIESSGIVVADTGTIYDQVVSDFQTALGSDLDTTAETPQGRLIQLVTDYRVNTLGLNAENANQINLRYATGRFLDAIGQFFGVTRIEETSTRVLATVTGISGTVIPSGSQAQTTAGELFYAENDITIPSGGSTTGCFLSVNKGEIACDLHTLTIIVNSVLGWETIDNSINATIGSEVESDVDFRLRIQSSRFKGISLLQAIKTRLANIDNVLSSFAYDNGTDETVTYDTIDIDPHSILVIVDGGDDGEIAKAIYQAKTGGAGYTAISGRSVTVTVTDGAYNVPYSVIFNRPEYMPIAVEITVRNVTYTGTDLETAVKEAIANWANGLVSGVDGLSIGQSVSPFEIAAAVSAEIPELYVKNCQIGLVSSGSVSTSEIDFTVAQVGAISTDNITVTVES